MVELVNVLDSLSQAGVIDGPCLLISIFSLECDMEESDAVHCVVSFDVMVAVGLSHLINTPTRLGILQHHPIHHPVLI